jgi:hypothetical protein
MVNYILFNVIIIFAGFIAILIFSIGFMACLAPMALFAKSENPPKAFMFPLMGIAGVYQVYFWGFWSAFCVAVTITFTHKPEVTWDWLYWITGFIDSASLIGWLAHKERQGSQSLKEARGIEKGTTFYVAFLVFAFAPSLMLPPYGWALKPLGLQRHIASKTVSGAEIDGKTRRSVEAFFEGYDYAVSANKLAQGMESSKDPRGDFEKAQTLLNKSKEKLSEIDIQVLNNIYAGWGDIVHDKFIPAIDFDTAGNQPEGSGNDLARRNALLAEWDNWLRDNRNKMLLRLHEEYGFEIK